MSGGAVTRADRPIARLCLAVSVIVLIGACERPLYPPRTPDEVVRPATGTAERPSAPTTFEPLPEAQPADPGIEPMVKLGSGRFVKTPATTQPGPAGPAPDPAAEESVTLNFADADIREVVRAVLGDLLQLNYIIEPEVAGRVTVQSSRPVPRSALLTTLESVLQLNGAALVPDGDVYKVVALDGASPPPVPLLLSPAGAARVPGYGIAAIPLRFVAAGEMAKIIEPFVAQGSILKVDPARNLLLVAGTVEEREALSETVEIFDVDWLAGTSFGLFPLKEATAETVAEELGILFGGTQDPAQQDLIRFVPVERLNAILVISLQPQYLKEAQNWIAQLDRSTDAAAQRVFVYFVENQRASELAEVLGQVFGAETQTVGQPTLAPGLSPVAIESPELGTEDVTELDSAPPLQTFDAGSLPQGEGIVIRGESEIRIIAVDSSNSLVILATPRDYRLVEDAIKRLDVLPLQVLIEATILEVTLNDDLRFGVQWFFDSGDSEFTLSEFADGTIGSLFPGFSYVFQSTSDVRLVVNALSEITDVNVVSSPQLMVLDNQSAELQVGDEVPVATQQAVSVTDADAPIVNSIEFRDTGVILRVTPRVNSGGLVVMDIEQEVSSVVQTTTSGIDSPTIRQRRLTSTVAIQSGETVTLGGLIRDETNRTSSGIPLLSDIPVLGFMFGSRADDRDRTELLVLITPRVVRNQREARDVTNELRQRMQAIEPLPSRIQ